MALRPLYGGTDHLLASGLLGIDVTWARDAEDVARAVRPSTGLVLLQTPQNPAFDPERLDDYEAGLKFADRSGRFKADAAVFHYDYSDLQVSAITPIGSATTNATSAEIYGLDLQLGARLGERHKRRPGGDAEARDEKGDAGRYLLGASRRARARFDGCHAVDL